MNFHNQCSTILGELINLLGLRDNIENYHLLLHYVEKFIFLSHSSVMTDEISFVLPFVVVKVGVKNFACYSRAFILNTKKLCYKGFTCPYNDAQRIYFLFVVFTLKYMH